VQKVALERVPRAVFLTRTEAGMDVPLEPPPRVAAESQEALASKIDVLGGVPRLSMPVGILQARPVLVVPQRLVDTRALGGGFRLGLTGAVRGGREQAEHDERYERGPRSSRGRLRSAASDPHDGGLSPDQRERSERAGPPALGANVLSRLRPLAEEQLLSRQLHEVEFLRARGHGNDP
jgi:hypothetical protein